MLFNFDEVFDKPNIDNSIFKKLSQYKHRFASIDKMFISENIKSINDYDLAIVGVPDDRNTTNKGCSKAPDEVRKELNKLFLPFSNMKIIDLGNLKKGKKISDTYFALKEIISHLLKIEVLPIIIGGGKDLVYANFLAYESLEQKINIVSIDSRFNIGNVEKSFNSESYLSKIILKQSSYLFNFSNLGYQTYYVSQNEINLINDLYFEAYRLGQVRSDLSEAEPTIRDCDLFSIDISSIKQADAPAHLSPSPNGFYGEELCQLARYAGISDKLSSFGIYELNPLFDNNNQTSGLAAQILWYFIEGFYNRKKDYPFSDLSDYKKFIINFNNNQKLVFYKSPKTERWWIEVSYPNDKNRIIASCSYNDYVSASKHELPDRWWKIYQKIS